MSDSTAPTWSLITVSYNSRAALEAHWGAALPSHVEWIVVDNASTDGSAEAAESLGASVIRMSENLGFGGANNAGFRAARGEFVAFVNPDLTVDVDSLTALERSLAREPGLVAPQLVYPDGELQPSGRSTPSLRHKVTSRLGSRSSRDHYYILAQPGEERYVAWMTGAAVVGRVDDLNKLGEQGPWDERFFVYYEDSDLGLRAWSAGLTVRVIGDARWTHSWARETTGIRLKPWMLELSSMWGFYSRYPSLILANKGGRRFRAMHDSHWGRLVETAPTEKGPE